MSKSRLRQTEDELVENFLREQHEESFSYNDGINENEGGMIGQSDDETSLAEDIRKIARALAPQISEQEDVMRDFSETETADAYDRLNSRSNANDISRSMMEDEDDDLDDDLRRLAMSEQTLREELDFAARMSMLGSPSPIRGGVDPEAISGAVDLPSPVDLSSRLEQNQPSEVPDTCPAVSSAYTLQDHADYLQLKTEKTGLWYYIQMTSKLLPTAISGAESDDLIKDYCLPIPFRKLKRVYGGLVFYDVWENKRRQAAQQTPSQSSANTPTPRKGGVFNRLLQTPAKPTNVSSATTPGGYTMAVPPTPATPTMNNKTPTKAEPRTPLQPISASKIENNNNSNVEEPLPVRTITVRVRPDVLCGAIMDAAAHAFEILPSDCTTHIIKRQGGHLRGAVYLPKEQLAYVADIQLCTQKNDVLERRLLLRFYHIQDDPDALTELAQILHRKQQQETERNTQSTTNENDYSSTMPGSENNDVMAKERSIANRHLKQTCSLIQRLMAADKQKGGVKKMDHNLQSRYVAFMVFALEISIRITSLLFRVHVYRKLTDYLFVTIDN